MRPFKALVIICFAVLVAAASVAVVPGTVPNLASGMRERPESPALITACWLVATSASIAGKRAIADGVLSWRVAAAAHVIGTVSNRVIPAGAGAGGAYVIALRRGGKTLTTAAAIAALWALASGIAHGTGALVGLVWLYSGLTGMAVLAVAVAVGGWRVRAHRARSPEDREEPATSPDTRPSEYVPRKVVDEHTATETEPLALQTMADTTPAPATRRALIAEKLSALRAAVVGAVAAIRANPRRAGMAVAAQAGAMSCLAIGFAISASGFGVPAPMTTLVAAYVIGTAVSSTVPTPAGIGSADAALVGALVMVGASLGAAIPAVLVFRAVILLAPIALAVVIPIAWTPRLWLRRRRNNAPAVG